MKHQKLQWVESGRGLAALAVLLVHCGNMMLLPQYSGEIGLGGIFKHGHLGVDFFFVLSGFIMYLVNYKAGGQPGELPKYVVRRVARIFPAYWTIFFSTLFINQLAQRDKATVNTDFLLGEVFLTNPGVLFVGPAWTLQLELIFYTIFATFFFGKKIVVLALSAWVLFLLASSANLLDSSITSNLWIQKFLTPYMFHFIVGIIIGYWHIHKKPLAICLVSCVLVFCAAFAAGLGSSEAPLTGSLARASAFGALLSTLLMLEARAVKPIRAFVWLGKVSYSLYLIHVFTIGYLFALLSKLNIYPFIPQFILVLAATLLSCFAAWVLYVVVETPSMRLGQIISQKLSFTPKASAEAV
jgi:exopolysaccharide production protein ExoZ